MNGALYEEAFNARFIPFEDVAKRFVPNQHFHDLLGNEHTLLVGPRGSGKTTLFKMLTHQALYEWQHEDAEEIRARLPFRAVYIASDVQWWKQLRALEESPEIDPQDARRRLICRSAATTNVFLHFVETLQAVVRTELKEYTDEAVEASIAKSAIAAWELPRTLTCFDALKSALRSRCSRILSFAHGLERCNVEGDTGNPQFLSLDAIAALGVVCDAFESAFPKARGRKWALCFDELEIAPIWLQKELFAYLRSTDQRLLFKLCTMPTPPSEAWPETMLPQSGADFRQVFLAAGGSRSPDGAFSRELAATLIQRALGRRVDPVDFFGTSPFERQKEEYERGSATWKTFKHLAARDASFADTLERQDIDPTDPTTSDRTLRDRLLRKAKPTAIIRQAYTSTAADGTLRRKPRKVGPIYYGWDVISRACEGNPRWLTGLVTDLLKDMGQADWDRRPVLSTRTQAGVLRKTSDKFASFLSVLPELTLRADEEKIPLWTFLDGLGRQFHQGLTGPTFLLDPACSFRVDKDLPEDLLERLRLAEFNGAIVGLTYGKEEPSAAMRGREFRLSHMLAPKFGLPMRKYKAVSLLRCLESIPTFSKLTNKRPRRLKRPAISAQQQKLIDEGP